MFALVFESYCKVRVTLRSQVLRLQRFKGGLCEPNLWFVVQLKVQLFDLGECHGVKEQFFIENNLHMKKMLLNCCTHIAKEYGTFNELLSALPRKLALFETSSFKKAALIFPLAGASRKTKVRETKVSDWFKEHDRWEVNVANFDTTKIMQLAS